MGRKKLPPSKPEVFRSVGFRYIEPDVAFELTQGIIELFSDYLMGRKPCDNIEWIKCFDDNYDGSGSVELTFKPKIRPRSEESSIIKIGILFMEYPYFELYGYDDNNSYASFIINGDGEIEVCLHSVSAIFDMFKQFLPELYNDYSGAPYWEYVKHVNSDEPTWLYTPPLIKWRYDNEEPIINKIYKYMK